MPRSGLLPFADRTGRGATLVPAVRRLSSLRGKFAAPPLPFHAIYRSLLSSGGTLKIVIRDVEIAHQLPLKARPQIMVPMNGDNGRLASYGVAVLGMAA